MIDSREKLKQTKRWVVKIGSAMIAGDRDQVNQAGIANWSDQIKQLKQQGIEVVLVSSGAVACGMQVLDWGERPGQVNELQAAAAVGQSQLINCWQKAFNPHEITSAQLLLDHDDIADRKRYLNAKSTLLTLLDLGVVPIVNENDSVVTSEIKFGDNDTLAALVTNLVEADLLVILTDQSAMYEQDPSVNPNAKPIEMASATDNSLLSMASEGAGRLGRGGMITKVHAARVAARSGAATCIASGRAEDVLLNIHAGLNQGTLLTVDNDPISAKAQWISSGLKPKGQVWMDMGATEAILTAGKSLLSAGVVKLEGDFVRGDLVEIFDHQNQLVAKGLVNYDCEDAANILGKHSDQIVGILGFQNDTSLIHRNNMVIVNKI